MKALTAVAVTLMLLSFSVFAEVKQVMKVEKITVQNGREVKSPADQAAPGEIIQYSDVCINQDKSPIGDFVVTIPVPASTEYVAGSATPVAAMASIDGVNFSPIPLKHKVKNSEGKTVEQEVPASEYRAVRWSLPLAGSESRTVSLRVKVR
jgi:hypothetical protein